MIKNKHISKITMLTCLMLAGFVNAQEFYTCVPKKSWWMDTIKESVPNNTLNSNNLANIIAEGVRKGQKQEWNLITTIDFTKILNDSNLNQNNISIYDKFLSPGTYKFRLILKHKDGSILNIFENKMDLVKNEYLMLDSLLIDCFFNPSGNFEKFLNFVNSYNYDKVIFVQDRGVRHITDKGKCSHIGIRILKLSNIALFMYETYEYNAQQDYIIDNDASYYNNIFRYSTLEIYKQNDS